MKFSYICVIVRGDGVICLLLWFSYCDNSDGFVFVTVDSLIFT